MHVLISSRTLMTNCPLCTRSDSATVLNAVVLRTFSPFFSPIPFPSPSWLWIDYLALCFTGKTEAIKRISQSSTITSTTCRPRSRHILLFFFFFYHLPLGQANAYNCVLYTTLAHWLRNSTPTLLPSGIHQHFSFCWIFPSYTICYFSHLIDSHTCMHAHLSSLPPTTTGFISLLLLTIKISWKHCL